MTNFKVILFQLKLCSTFTNIFFFLQVLQRVGLNQVKRTRSPLWSSNTRKHTSTLQQNATSFATLPIGCFPITSISHSVKCKLGATGSSFKVKVTQLPCVSALVLITGHKIQGRTLDAVILGALSRIHKSGRSGWIYVILSRVRTLNGLFLLTLLETDPKKYKPRTDVMTEMNRLHLIEKSTLARLESC